jgi:hypothetical protein
VTTSSADDPLEGQGPGDGAIGVPQAGLVDDLDVHTESGTANVDDNQVNGVSASQEGTDAAEDMSSSKTKNGVSDPIAGDGIGSSNDDNHGSTQNSEPDMGQVQSNENDATHPVDVGQTPSNNKNIPNGVAHGSVTGKPFAAGGGEGGNEMNGNDYADDDATGDDDQSEDSDEATATGEGTETDEVVTEDTEVDEDTGTSEGDSGSRNSQNLPNGQPNGHIDLFCDGESKNGDSGGGHPSGINGVDGIVNGVEGHENVSLAAQSSGEWNEDVARGNEGGSGLSQDHIVKEAEGVGGYDTGDGGGGSASGSGTSRDRITIDTNLSPTFNGDDGDESDSEFFDSSEELTFPESSLPS